MEISQGKVKAGRCRCRHLPNRFPPEASSLDVNATERMAALSLHCLLDHDNDSYDEENANDIMDVVELYMLSGECATSYELTLKIPSLLHIWSSDPLRAHN